MTSPTHVRNITVIGHVDHGKTTFVDSLLAANNIISSRMAGKIRFMDSREDEQERGITMESSAISLRFQILRKLAPTGSSTDSYVINLIDTPGHVDFSTEVSTASRLCDGALVLVDVVEGVCTQTISVLRQAWVDRLRPVLVLNKMDRLITELKLSPVEAHHHLMQLIEQVNAVMGGFFAAERMEDDLRWREEREKRLREREERATDVEEALDGVVDSDSFLEKDDEDIYFAPERGNVLFASAIDGWAFRIGTFSRLYAEKLGVKEENLRRALWGDYYLEPKSKRVIGRKHLNGRNLKPLFVQFVLENVWSVYQNVSIKPNAEKVGKIVTTLNLKIPARDLNSKDTRHLLSTIFSKWLSLSSCTFQAVVDVVPPPSVAQRTRIPRMLYPDQHEHGASEPRNKLEQDLYSCKTESSACVTAYISKMFAVPRKDLPENKKKPLTAEEMRQRARQNRVDGVAGEVEVGDIAQIQPETATPGPALEKSAKESVEAEEALLGFSRLYSGTLSRGMKLYCVLPRYSCSVPPSDPSNARQLKTVTVEALYVIMGRDLVPVDSVAAGNVFAISGLEGVVLRNATLCSLNSKGDSNHVDPDEDRECLVNLASTVLQAPPIVRVALEPTEPANMPKLIKGLRLLTQADPCVESFQQQTGEYVILTAGELHLERCLKDLRERFAQIEIQASKPIVPFRETALRVADMAPPKNPEFPRGTVKGASAHSLARFTLRMVPLPPEIVSFLQTNASVIRHLHSDQSRLQMLAKWDTAPEGQLALEDEVISAESEGGATVRPDEFWVKLEEHFTAAGSDWKGTSYKLWSFGPKHMGSCILINRTPNVFQSLRENSQADREGLDSKTANGLEEDAATQGDSNRAGERFLRDFSGAIETGFQIASFQGPLCAEPVVGMACIVQSLEFDAAALDREENRVRMPQITGSLITAVREAFRNGLLDWSPRLMLAMYACDIQASTEVLGRVYGVIAKRRGRIVSEEMKEGTSFFTIRALLPVVESFGFADDIRKRTSGAASPQLIFHGYEVLDQDPFWVPTTEEELEDLGEKADRANVAKMYMDGVRERKGMSVDKKIVEFAEKQRTLKR